MSQAPDQPCEIRDVVAIDGPSGAGKSTVARGLARQLGFAYLDTGAMYRAVTWVLLESQCDLADEGAVHANIRELDLRVSAGGEVSVGDRDVTAHIRSQEVESRVSTVSAMSSVRATMRDLQRRVAARGPIVAEGRDMGSVVFPEARWKFYLDACPDERARRRQQDFAAAGREITTAEVLEEMAVRDRLDSTRKDAPLVRASDAELVDTTGLEIEQVIERLVDRVRAGLD